MPETNISEKTTAEEDGDGLIEEGFGGVGVEDEDVYAEGSDVEDERWGRPEPAKSERIGTDRDVTAALQCAAESSQRLVISGLRRMYVRGRQYCDAAVTPKPITSQRRVDLSSYITVTDPKVPELISKLKEGRVITRMGAPPGFGKTTRIPAEIAVGAGLRVCQLELNAHVATAAFEWQRKNYGLPGSNRVWSRGSGPYLTVMSYVDFRAYVCSASRARLFADFDVFYMDEAHVSRADVYVALQYFAVYAQQHNSLIVASATVSVDESNNVASKRVGEFKMVETSLRDALDSAKLTTTYLKDRTMLLVASDADVWYSRTVYEDQGVQVMTLDSASTKEDVDSAYRMLRYDSITPRVLIATSDYGTGYNFPVSYVVTTASRLKYDWNLKGQLTEVVEPLTEREVTQHKARTGRALAVGSGGIVLSKKRSDEVALDHSERVEAYLSLVAASIKPLPAQWTDVMTLVPKGVTRDVALRILSVALPPMLTLRYIGRDGNIAGFFAQAITMYTQPDHYIVPSVDLYPISYDSWVSENYGGYFEGDESWSQKQAKVPFASPASLKPIMHALYAFANGEIKLERWRPDLPSYESSGSEDEVTRPAVKHRIILPRLVVDTEVTVPAPVSRQEEASWRFDVPENQQAKRKKRAGRDWTSSPGGQRAVQKLNDAVNGKILIGVMTAEVRSHDNDLTVHTPNGTVALTLSKATYRKLSVGEVLSGYELCSLVENAQKKDSRFVESSLFANWGPPWLSFFNTCMDDAAVSSVVLEGKMPSLLSVIGRLYTRFRDEAIHVCRTSNVYRTKLERFFKRRPSLTRLVNEIAAGKLSIAQSDQFIERVLTIKLLHDKVLLYLERKGYFVPSQITQAQRQLPLRDKSRRLGVVDATVTEAPNIGEVIK